MKKSKKGINESQTYLFSRDFLKDHYHVVEDTLLFHPWLKQGSLLDSEFEVKFCDIDSKVFERVKNYLQKTKEKIVRSGNNVKTS